MGVELKRELDAVLYTIIQHRCQRVTEHSVIRKAVLEKALHIEHKLLLANGTSLHA